MARNTSVSLGEHVTAFLDEQVESGRYASSSDVIRAYRAIRWGAMWAFINISETRCLSYVFSTREKVPIR